MMLGGSLLKLCSTTLTTASIQITLKSSDQKLDNGYKLVKRKISQKKIENY
jgi:hypothetical protein